MGLIYFTNTAGSKLSFTGTRRINLSDGAYTWDMYEYFYPDGYPDYDTVGRDTAPDASTANRENEGKIWNDAGQPYVCRNTVEFDEPALHTIEINVTGSSHTQLLADYVNVNYIQIVRKDGQIDFSYILPRNSFSDFIYNFNGVSIVAANNVFIGDQISMFVKNRGGYFGSYVSSNFGPTNAPISNINLIGTSCNLDSQEYYRDGDNQTNQKYFKCQITSVPASDYYAAPMGVSNYKSGFLRPLFYFELLQAHTTGQAVFQIDPGKLSSKYKLNLTAVKNTEAQGELDTYRNQYLTNFLSVETMYSRIETAPSNPLRFLQIGDRPKILYFTTQFPIGAEIIGATSSITINGANLLSAIRIYGSKRKNSN